MSNEKRNAKVYILGAGCSANYGYPTAKEFVTELGAFAKALEGKAPRLNLCVEETVGAQVRIENGSPRFYPYYHGQTPGTDIQISDALFFNSESQKEFPEQELQPLLLFPHEKQRVISGGQDSLYGRYLTRVWDQAKKVMAGAREIWIIGYSFAALDRSSVVDLLAEAKNCKRGIIQNLPGEAERICRLLKTKHPKLPVNWEPYSEEF